MVEDSQQPTNVAPTEFYGLFAGLIDQVAVQRFHNFLSIATQKNAKTIHLLFQSSGGNIGDGISLYNLFRTSPVEIALYNVGAVCSAAVIAYLGATKRKVSAYGAFMIHRAYLNPVSPNSDRMTAGADQLAMEDARTEGIIKSHTNLPRKRWNQHKFADVWLSSVDAVQYGFAEIGEFSPPIGTTLFNVWPPQA